MSVRACLSEEARKEARAILAAKQSTAKRVGIAGSNSSFEPLKSLAQAAEEQGFQCIEQIECNASRPGGVEMRY